MGIHDFLTDFNLDNLDTTGREIHAIGVHIGWLNWGSVGDESLEKLIEYYDAEKIAEFTRPGDYYDFVAYRERSLTYIDNKGIRRTEYPNSRVYYVRRYESENDLLLLSLLEPNHFSEIFVDRVVTLLKKLNITRYTVAGAMGSPVPHTRPIRITGRSSDSRISEKLETLGVRQTLGRQYQGPTSIFNTISQKLTDEGITSVNLMTHIPSHISLQEPDFTGVHRILTVLSKLEGIDIPLEKTRTAGNKQYERVSKEVRNSPSLTELSRQLEEIYDQEEGPSEEDTVELPPSIQQAIDEAFGKE
ncbi:MAG: PAC2 family protein [Dehalococcoidales bacterium]|nr:MAG: PAC2 family protein [Dehalococcoidales bacterium]